MLTKDILRKGAGQIMNKLKEAITGTAAKAADRYAIDVLGIPSLELMERASRHVTDLILRSFPPVSDKSRIYVTILCSVGNNGADGVCIARQLLDEDHGFCPRVLVCGILEKATWEFLYQLAEYKKRSGEILYLRPEDPSVTTDMEISDTYGRLFADSAVIVDALFGIGLRRPVEGIFRQALRLADSVGSQVLKISVDIPSGINADDGRCMGICFHADHTLTFGKNKKGLLTGEGPTASGTVTVCDIGIPKEAYDSAI